MDLGTVCGICGKNFGNTNSLQQHVAAKHSGEEKSYERKKVFGSAKKLAFYAVLIIVVVGIGYLFVIASQLVPTGIGPAGSEHTHSNFTFTINGKVIDFSSPEEQMHTKEVHFENSDGKTVHKHATGVTIGYFLKTIPIIFKENCLEFEKTNYCENEEKIKLALNGGEIMQKEFLEHNLIDEDKFSITYG